MKKQLSVITVLLIFILSSCNTGSRQNIDDFKLYEDVDYNFNTDWQYYYGTSDLKTNITMSPNGYYICNGSGFTQFIDGKSQKITPLCSKPNCNHNDKDFCDAYIRDLAVTGSGFKDGMGTHSLLQYYDGKLYYVISKSNSTTMSEDYYLASMDLDGQNKKAITDKLNIGSNIYSWLIHRGCFFGVTSSCVFRVNLENKHMQEIYELKEYIEGSNNISSIAAYNNDLYIMYEDVYTENGIKRFTGDYKIVRIDLKTLNNYLCIYDGREINISSFLNGQVLFYCIDKDNYMIDYYLCNNDFSNFSKVVTLPIGQTLTTDGKYYYSENGGEIQMKKIEGKSIEKSKEAEEYFGQAVRIFDLEMNEIDSFIIPSKNEYTSFSAQDQNYFIFFLYDEIKEKNSYYILEKSKIGTYQGSVPELANVD